MIWVIFALLAATVLLGGSAVAGSFGRPLSTFADAIAHAEGFYIVGDRAWRNNNPGDMILAPPASNYTSVSDGTYAKFDSVADGWQALEDELDLIRRKVSGHYWPEMTFEQMARIYSPDGWQNWSVNVSRFVGAAQTEAIGNYL